MIAHDDIDDGPLYSKCHKVCCCHSCCFPCNFLFGPCRRAVSRKKKRYEKESFSLDLVYMNDRIIVHGFPAAGIEHMYRNPRGEIRRFLDSNHEDHYMLYNFCCEPGRGYDPDIFHGRVGRFPFKDHNTPPLRTMVAFAAHAKNWLEKDPENVCSLHCKAGKGRAGLMCCVLLVRSGFAQSALEAMDYYDRHRTHNGRGLTVTSQRKYVIFYELLWRQHWGVTGDIGKVPAPQDDTFDDGTFRLPEEPKLRLVGVQILGLWSSVMRHLDVKVYQGTNFNPVLLCNHGVVCPEAPNKWFCDCEVQGNFKVFISQRGLTGSKKVFEMWHNTLFLDMYVTRHRHTSIRFSWMWTPCLYM